MTTTQQDKPAAARQDAPAPPEPLTPLNDNRAEMAIQTADQVLEITADQRFWTKAQRSALASIGLANAPTHEQVAFFHICKSTGLDPFRREIYYIARKRKVGKQEELFYTAQTGIDGFRHIGQRTKRFIRRQGPFWTGPEDDPKWWVEGEDGINRRRWVDVWLGEEHPAAAMCRIEHYSIAGDRTVSQAVALFKEFAVTKDEWTRDAYGEGQRTGNKILSGLWPGMGTHMIGKVAEAQAWRIAFPRELTGIYEHDEMGRADVEQRELAREEGAARRRAARSESSQPGPVVIRGTVVESTTEDRDPETDPDGDQQPSPSQDDAAGPPTFEELRAELRAYAAALGRNVTQVTRRWRESNGKNTTEATPEELSQLLDGLRDHVVAALRAYNEDAAQYLAAGGMLVRQNPDHRAWGRRAADQA